MKMFSDSEDSDPMEDYEMHVGLHYERDDYDRSISLHYENDDEDYDKPCPRLFSDY